MGKSSKIMAGLIFGVFVALVAFVGLSVFKPGTIYHMDVTDGLNVRNLVQRYLFTYSNDTSEPLTLAEKARLPLFSIMFSIFKISTIFYNSSDNYVKVKILLLFVISFWAFVTYTYKLARNLVKTEDKSKILMCTTLGGLYYILNYWFVNRIVHFGLFFTTALIPIAFYYLYMFLLHENGSFKDLLKLTVFLFFFTATPHAVLMFGVILIAMLITALVVDARTLAKKLPNLLVFIALYLLVSAFWLAPFLVSQSKPDAILNKTIVETINKETYMPKPLLLQTYWLAPQTDYYANVTRNVQIFFAWIPFVIFAVTLLAYFSNKRVFLPLAIIFAVSLFLTTSNQVTQSFYYALMFKLPTQSVGWLLREYDKFGAITAYVYSLALVLFALKVKKKPVQFLSLTLILCVLISNFYYLNFTLKSSYTPVKIPEDFSAVNTELNNDKSEFNVVWYPGVPKPTWANSEEVRFIFSNLESAKPSFVQSSDIINYTDYLFKLDQLVSVDIGNALNLVGVKYLIIRNDGTDTLNVAEINRYLKIQPNLVVVKETPFLTLYLNKKFDGLAKIYSSRVVTNLGLDFLKKYPPYSGSTLNGYIDYTDKYSGLSKDLVQTNFDGSSNISLDYVLTNFQSRFVYPYKFSYIKEDGNPGAWKTGSLENLNHAELSYFFSDLGLNISQFDYTNGVVIARDGWQKISPKIDGELLGLQFSSWPNVIFDGKDLGYTAKDSDFKSYWNIIRSDKFEVTGKKALNIKLNQEISEDLIPHYKVTFFDGSGIELETIPIYAPPNGVLDTIINVDSQAKSADFSIWTLSAAQKYKYSLKNLGIFDVSGNVEPVTMTFSANTQCSVNCQIYARVLTSTIGGKLDVGINGNAFGVDSKIPDTSTEIDSYKWLKLGEIANLQNPAHFKLVNIQGFNSVNAIVAITKDEEPKLSDITNTALSTQEVAQNTPGNPEIHQINPTLYKLSVPKDIDQPLVVAFAKPYSTSWRFSAGTGKPLVINGYINGWYVQNLKAGTYYFSHRPQTFYLSGLSVSGVAVISIAVYLIISARVVTKSEPKSKSQG